MKKNMCRNDRNCFVPNNFRCDDYHIGKYGNLRLNFIKEYRKDLFDELKANCGLKDYLVDVDKYAKNEVNKLIKEFAKLENVPVYFSGGDVELWVKCMNRIKDKAEEIVICEVVLR